MKALRIKYLSIKFKNEYLSKKGVQFVAIFIHFVLYSAARIPTEVTRKSARDFVFEF